MTRLIDADAIPWLVEGVGDIPVITKEEIDQMPTVDAVPVIRCKDCKHRKLRSREKVWTCLFSDWIFPEHYCSYAKRKEE